MLRQICQPSNKIENFSYRHVQDCFVYDRNNDKRLSVKTFYLGTTLNDVLGITGACPIDPVDNMQWNVATIIGNRFDDKSRLYSDTIERFSEANYRVSYFACNPLNVKRVSDIYMKQTPRSSGDVLGSMFKGNTDNILQIEKYLEEEATLCGSILVSEHVGEKAHICVKQREKQELVVPSPRFYQISR